MKTYYKFCFACGSDNLSVIQEDLVNCQNCHKNLYINPKPSTAALLLNNRHELLLCKRAVDPGKDLWDLPGGFIDINESVEQALDRELVEELGISLTGLTYFNSAPDRYLYHQINYYTLGINFTATISDELIAQLKPTDDVASVSFFALTDIPYETISSPDTATIIRTFVATHP